jgi:hypothetical protein
MSKYLIIPWWWCCCSLFLFLAVQLLMLVCHTRPSDHSGGHYIGFTRGRLYGGHYGVFSLSQAASQNSEDVIQIPVHCRQSPQSIDKS